MCIKARRPGLRRRKPRRVEKVAVTVVHNQEYYGDMSMGKVMKLGILLASAIVIGAGCSPEVGSEGWCNQMDKKPKGEWTVNEGKEYATNCIFRKTE